MLQFQRTQSNMFFDVSTFLVFAAALLVSLWFLVSRRGLPPGPWGNPLFGQLLEAHWSTEYYLRLSEYK